MMCNKTIKLAAAAIAAGVLLNCSGCGLKTQENNNSVSSPTQTADSADTDSLAKAPPPVAS